MGKGLRNLIAGPGSAAASLVIDMAFNLLFSSLARTAVA